VERLETGSFPGATTRQIITRRLRQRIRRRHIPIGTLSLFVFGFGATGIDLFEVDSTGDIFAVPFMGGGTPLLLNTSLHLLIAVLADGRLLALLAGSNGQDYLIDIISPFNPLSSRR